MWLILGIIAGLVVFVVIRRDDNRKGKKGKANFVLGLVISAAIFGIVAFLLPTYF